MKRVRCLLVVLVLVALVISTASMGWAAGKVTLTLGSWRTDDVVAIGKLLTAFTKANPNISIKFNPTNPPEYNSVLRTQLTGGTGPDLMYLRSFKVGADLYRDGFVSTLTDVKGITDNYSEVNLSPWTLDGVNYGLPLAAVSHGIYYNVDIFKKNKISIPKTWEELIAAAKTLKAAGITPFANGSKDQWDMNEIVFMNILPNFVGGMKARVEYETGKVPFNDAKMVSVFQAIKDIAPYLPAGQGGVSYPDAQNSFALGESAMFLGGSWDIAYFEKAAPDLNWSVFAVPAPAGKPTIVCFHPDCAIGVNKASKYQNEAKTFISWLMSKQAAQIIADQLVGFYPLSKNGAAIKMASKHAAAFYAISAKKETDLRFDWPKLIDAPQGKTDGYTLTQNAAIAVAAGTMTPQQAADSVQAGLEEWFQPTMHFKK